LSWLDYRAKPRPVDTHQEHLSRGRLTQREVRHCLSKPFDEQHTGDDRSLGKVAREKGFVRTKQPGCDNSHRRKLDDAIDEEERLAMGNHRPNVGVWRAREGHARSIDGAQNDCGIGATEAE
jgi:hypothetical protein